MSHKPYEYTGYNFNEERPRQEPRFPEGEYEFTIAGWTKRINNKGMLTYRLNLKCTDGNIKGNNEILFYEIQLGTKKTDKMIGRLLDALGLDPSVSGTIDDDFFNDMIGEWIDCQVWHKTLQGDDGRVKTYTNVTPLRRDAE